MLAMIMGQLVGLVRGVLVASAFQARELDAFFAANRVSETLFTLIAAGSLASAFIPRFTSLLAHKESQAAWRLASSLATWVLIVLAVLSTAAALLAQPIVGYVLAPGFASDPALFALTVSLLRIQLMSVALFGLGGLTASILNAHQRFLIPALAPLMYQLGLIIGVVVLARSLGIAGLAWGVVLGAVLYLLIQVPSVMALPAHSGRRLGFTLGRGNADTRAVVMLMVPRTLGIAVVQVNFWVNIWLASRMAAGSVAALQYGFSLMLTGLAVIAQSVAIAALPTFSAQHALGKTEEFGRSIIAILRAVILLALPASIGIMLLSTPIVATLYQHGAFDARMTELVSWALIWYSAGLLGHSMLEVITRAYFSQQDTRTPVLVGAAAMALNIVLSLVLSGYFARFGWWALGGLALANGTTTALEVMVLWMILNRRLGAVHSQPVFAAAAHSLAGSMIMAVVLALWLRLGLAGWIQATGGVIIGTVVYISAILLMRVPEGLRVVAVIRERLAADGRA